MKKEITCIKNRVKWSKDLLEDLKVIAKEQKNEDLKGIYYDLSFDIGQIGFYIKELEKRLKKEWILKKK